MIGNKLAPRTGVADHPWAAFVNNVQSAADLPALALEPFQIPPNSVGFTNMPQNGPFSANAWQSMGAALALVPPGQFWRGAKTANLDGVNRKLRLANHQHPPYEAGIFVGFRRKNRPLRNPWWWEVVYADFDSQGNLILHAYDYNYLGMPLTPRNKKSSWKVKNIDMLWIRELEGATKQAREDYVTTQWETWRDGVRYHTHGRERNGLRMEFGLPPYRV